MKIDAAATFSLFSLFFLAAPAFSLIFSSPTPPRSARATPPRRFQRRETSSATQARPTPTRSATSATSTTSPKTRRLPCSPSPSPQPALRKPSTRRPERRATRFYERPAAPSQPTTTPRPAPRSRPSPPFRAPRSTLAPFRSTRFRPLRRKFCHYYCSALSLTPPVVCTVRLCYAF